MKSLQAPLPFRWPFPAVSRLRTSWRTRAAAAAAAAAPAHTLTRKAMVIDVLMVLSWGASIPALMWLGAVGGF